MDGTSGKASEVDPALHKKMLQLLSSLWVTRAIGAFARLRLADAMAQGPRGADRRIIGMGTRREFQTDNGMAGDTYQSKLSALTLETT